MSAPLLSSEQLGQSRWNIDRCLRELAANVEPADVRCKIQRAQCDTPAVVDLDTVLAKAVVDAAVVRDADLTETTPQKTESPRQCRRPIVVFGELVLTLAGREKCSSLVVEKYSIVETVGHVSVVGDSQSARRRQAPVRSESDFRKRRGNDLRRDKR